jgi:membrane protease YdiL (CAAX protease family)
MAVWLILLSCGYALAAYHGSLGLQSLPAFALLALAWAALRYPRLRWVGHGLFVVLALALALHRLPGFDNARVIDAVVLSPGATPLTLYLNLDKPLAGFWLLLACPWLILKRRGSLRGLALRVLGTVAIVLTAGVMLGAITWAAKWPEGAWLWAANNLLLVCIVEELLFRGYIQGGLGRLFERWSGGQTLALLAASVLFGVAHLGGGWQWLLLATAAGLGYGLAYRYAGLAGAVSCHFGLNLAHFGLFTYPLLASQ